MESRTRGAYRNFTQVMVDHSYLIKAVNEDLSCAKRETKKHNQGCGKGKK